jgi:hypothetical protein
MDASVFLSQLSEHRSDLANDLLVRVGSPEEAEEVLAVLAPKEVAPITLRQHLQGAAQ